MGTIKTFNETFLEKTTNIGINNCVINIYFQAQYTEPWT